MRIRSICVVKDEVDIIEETLIAACAWSDVIYVIDNGSTDGTWDALQDLASQHKQIVIFERTEEPFTRALRQRPFAKYARDCAEDDWWAQLDADEIYASDPRDFLLRVPKKYQNVWAASLQFYFTDHDLNMYRDNPDLYDRTIPIQSKIRYYLNNWSEARFFRFDRKLVWDQNRNWPYVGATFPERPVLKHYQYRSPEQIQKRIESRKQRAEKSNHFAHEMRDRDAWLERQFGDLPGWQQYAELRFRKTDSPEEWRDRIVPAILLDYDAGDGMYTVREDLMPKVPRTSLLGSTITNQLRFLKRYF